jgi:hypothetical protein
MAYDFIYDEDNKPYINEISYCFVDWMVHIVRDFGMKIYHGKAARIGHNIIN